MRHFGWQPWMLDDLTPEMIDAAERDLQTNPPGVF